VNFVKIKLLVIAVIMFAASSAFASFSYDVTVDTSSLNGTNGYLYFAYMTGTNNTPSTASVQSFGTDGSLGATAMGWDANSGQYVTGVLPTTVSFTNGTNMVNDLNQATTFGNVFQFTLVLPDSTSATSGSTFALQLFSDSMGMSPLKTADGTLFTANLNGDGTVSLTVSDAGTQATETPIPAAAWLFGSGLMGIAGIRRKKNA